VKCIIGKKGEDVAVRFLVKHGFSLVLRNFNCLYGEIDIIVQKNNILHFVEVKTKKYRKYVPRETYLPEDNVSREKMDKIGKTALVFLDKNNVSYETPWQIDIVAISLYEVNNRVKVSYIPDVV
jgi:putative endonuclease